MKRLKSICASTLLALMCMSVGCAAHHGLIIENFEPSGSMCWDALVVNQHVAGCVESTAESRGAYGIQRCVVYHDDADPASPWLVLDFYILRVAQENVEINLEVPIHPMCVDTSMLIMYGPRTQLIHEETENTDGQ